MSADDSCSDSDLTLEPSSDDDLRQKPSSDTTTVGFCSNEDISLDPFSYGEPTYCGSSDNTTVDPAKNEHNQTHSSDDDATLEPSGSDDIDGCLSNDEATVDPAEDSPPSDGNSITDLSEENAVKCAPRTDNEEDKQENEYFIGSLRTKLVLTYFKMPFQINVSPLEHVSFQNAGQSILVFNSVGKQFGELHRKIAPPLRMILDRKLASVQGRVLLTRMTNKHRVPVEVMLKCKDKNVETVHSILDEHGIRLNDSIPDEHDIWLNSMEADDSFDDTLRVEKLQDKLDRLFEDMQGNKISGQAEPSEIIKTELHNHQKEALYWMLEKEISDELPPFWKIEDHSFVNTLTDETTAERPHSVKGGILADDMGLGKTLVVISLIATNTKENQKSVENGQNAIPLVPDGCSTEASNKDDQIPSCSEPQGSKQLHKQEDDYTDSGSDSESEYWRNPFRKRKHSETDGSDDNGDSNEDASIFLKIKKKNDKKRQTGSTIGSTKEQNKSEAMDDSDSAIVISDSSMDDSNFAIIISDEEEDTLTCIQNGDIVEDDKDDDALESMPQKVEEDILTGIQNGDTLADDEHDDVLGIIPQKDGADAEADDIQDDLARTQEAQWYYLGPTLIPGGTSNLTSHKKSKATLVVCPTTIVPTWQAQFETHVHKHNRLKIHAFYGPKRITNRKYLTRRDVVLTTYGTVLADFKSKGCLHRINWYRIVLDEGHEIRNPFAQTTKAICSLQSGKKWVLSGTPIQNNIKDLWSLINFFEIHPLTDRNWWFKTIEWPLRAQKETAFRRLQHLICTIAIRRTKDILKLPKRTERIQKLQFSEEENVVYREMHDNAKPIVAAILANQLQPDHPYDRREYGLICTVQLRLRQMCCHPALFRHAKKAVSVIVALRGGIDEDKRHELVQKLLKVLKSENLECPICLDDWKSPVITPCKHVYCRKCILDSLGTNVAAGVHSTCPMCRAALGASQLVEAKAQDLEPDEQIDISVRNFKHSAKTRALMKSLIRLRDEDSSIKSMVVSFFTSFLDIIEIPLQDKGFRFVRIDGSMSMTRRERAVSSFMNTGKGSPTIILLSLRAGGQGITLTSASRVFLMEPWFNPSTEQQCFDRCHRLGQTKDVIITKFIMENSIEEGLLECQEKKLELMREAFKKPTAQEKKLQTIQNFRTAFGL